MVVWDFDEECNRQLDRVIEARRTIRAFTEEVPPRGKVEEILKAGLLAPFAAVAVEGCEDFRRFFVMERGSAARAEAVKIVRARVIAGFEAMKANLPEGVALPAFAGRLQAVADGGEIGFESAPYYVVIAEKRGIPPAEQESLAHVLENMWLKATALGIGMRLISATARLAEDAEFCGLLGLAPGTFGLDGCALGYPVEVPPPTRRPEFATVVTWLD
ncbi:MAG: nitroreductase family protein [Actinomycetota bacterium]